MATVVALSGSPSNNSRTEAVLSHVVRRAQARGHTVSTLVLRELPAAALLGADTSDPEIAAATTLVSEADAVIVATPIYKAAYSGLLKTFLDLLPQFALRGKNVLPLATGGSPAHVLAIDYALRPVLTSLGATHISQGWFVHTDQVRLYDGGGVLLDPSASGPLHDVTDEFLRALGGLPASQQSHPESYRGQPLSPGTLSVHHVSPHDPLAAPLIEDLIVEYGTRYGRDTRDTRLTEVSDEDFEPDNGGSFVVVREGTETIAGGAIRKLDDEVAEVKRVWTANRHRRRGLARRVLRELENRARELGYRGLYLTTGPRQPEAAGLYLSEGYQPQFDVEADPESIGKLAFTKTLIARPCSVRDLVPEDLDSPAVAS